jgi:hypothetical protein
VNPVLLAILGGAAVLALRKRGRPVPTFRGSVAVLPSVVAGDNRILQRIGELSQRARVPLVVTSWVRTPEAQARAMQDKVRRGEDLVALYQDKEQVRALLSLPYDQWAAAIREWAEDGRPLSRHLLGRGVDLRTRDLTRDQVARLVKVGRNMGANMVLESDHLHTGWPA